MASAAAPDSERRLEPSPRAEAPDATGPVAFRRAIKMRRLTLRKRSYVWWNVAGLLVFVAGFLVGSIAMARGGMSMGGGATAMTIAGVLQVAGGAVAAGAFTLEMRRRFRLKRQERRLSTP